MEGIEDMAVLTKVGVMSMAKFMGAMGAIMGLIFGIIMAVFLSAVGTKSGLGFFGGLGVLGILILPIAYGIGMFVAGAIYAFIMNVILGLVGGIELELK
ncbi:TPA: hypothetical protein HA244_02425 [Candidatus Micrarchaeota archaeon]|nr:hypothetical protein [Candidatus Micrarchaeota archaeon]